MKQDKKPVKKASNTSLVNVSKITEREKRFADEYLVCLNASQSYLKVFPTCKDPDVAAVQIMNRKRVKTYIQKKLKAIAVKQDLKAEDVIAELRKVGFAKITDYLSFDSTGVKFKNSNKLDCSVISEVSSKATKEGTDFRLKMHDKMKALDSLGRYFKLFDNDDNESNKKPLLIFNFPQLTTMNVNGNGNGQATGNRLIEPHKSNGKAE